MTIPSQEKKLGPRSDQRLVLDYGPGAQLSATIRHDDSCKNGHNSFAITGEVRTIEANRHRDFAACGMLHDDIGRLFPELQPHLKWHLTSTEGPMHYIENTMYWLGWRGWCDGKTNSPPSLENARSCAVWPDLPAEYLAPESVAQRRDHELYSRSEIAAMCAPIEAALRQRLPALIAEFERAVRSLGMEY